MFMDDFILTEKCALVLCEGLAAIGSENHIHIREIIPNILALLQSNLICQQGQIKVRTTSYINHIYCI